MKRVILSALLLLGFVCAPRAAAMSDREWFDESKLTITGVYYYPEHWKESQWERDMKQISDLGFEFIHLAEFAWAQIEPSEGVYDFAWLDRAVALAAKYNLKVIMCTSTATPPVWLTRAHPEILIKHEDGTSMDHGARQHASFSSPLYREKAYGMIARLAEHYGKDSRVFGWQLDNEPGVQYDYNDAAEAEFRDFLREKYHDDIAALNDAWGTSFWSEVYSSFDEINIPKVSQMFMNHHQILDYRRFATAQTNRFLDAQCNIIKRYAPDQWVTTNYIPNYDEGHLGNSKVLDFVSYTRYMVYGGDMGVGSRGYRVGDPLRIALANDFFRPMSKYYGVMELQPGQVNWGGINPQPLPGAVRLWLWSVFAGGSDFICTYRYRQPLYGTEQYHYGIVGTDGVTVTPGGEEYVQFMCEVKSLRGKVGAKAEKPRDYLARRTAILYNYENSLSIAQQPQTYLWDTWAHINKYYNTLKSFGAPVDVVDESADLSAYPVVIVPAYQMADKALADRLAGYAKQGGNLVITCRSGQKDRSGRLFEAPFGSLLGDVTGNSIEFFDLLMPSVESGLVSMDGKDYEWVTWGEVLKPTDKRSQVWASYGSEFYKGKPAVTHRPLGKGSVTYVGVDSKNGDLERDVLRKLYGELGISVMSLPYGVSMEYRNGLGIVLNYSDKEYSFELPSSAKILVGQKNIPTAGVLVFKY